MTTTNPHWARLELDPDTRALARSVCSCGWRSEPMPPEDAVEAGLVHTGTAVERND